MVDINLSAGAPTTNNDVELIIQQIDILFDTNYHEVFGAPEYGTNYDEFLYNLSLSNDSIAHRIDADLRSLNLFGFVPHVEVSIFEGTLNDIIIVQIALERNNEYYEKTYKIQ